MPSSPPLPSRDAPLPEGSPAALPAQEFSLCAVWLRVPPLHYPFRCSFSQPAVGGLPICAACQRVSPLPHQSKHFPFEPAVRAFPFRTGCPRVPQQYYLSEGHPSELCVQGFDSWPLPGHEFPPCATLPSISAFHWLSKGSPFARRGQVIFHGTVTFEGLPLSHSPQVFPFAWAVQEFPLGATQRRIFPFTIHPGPPPWHCLSRHHLTP